MSGRHTSVIKNAITGSTTKSARGRFAAHNKKVGDLIKDNAKDPDALMELAGELSQYGGSPDSDLANTVFGDDN